MSSTAARDAYALRMDDDLYDGFQPRCPADLTVMRDVDGGWECPECRHFEPLAAGPLPPEYGGPTLFDR